MTETKCGFVALIGEPNAGKSTLMNRIVGAKVSIVTHKVQTTRARIRGIAMQENSQLVFVDTPGLFKTRRKLDKAMVAAAWSGAADADIVVLIVEAHRGITDGVEMILEGLEKRDVKGQRLILAINKIDKIKSDALLSLTQSLNQRLNFEETFRFLQKKDMGLKSFKIGFPQIFLLGLIFILKTKLQMFQCE